MRKQPLTNLVLLGLSHGLGDAMAGFIVFNYPNTSVWGKVSAFIVYNVIAFGLQPVSGLLTDRLIGYKRSTFLGIGLTILGAVLSYFNVLAGIAILALGSSFFHVGAGAWAIKLTLGKSYGPGIFVAPGVLGLALGIYCGITQINIIYLLIGLLSITVLGLVITKNSYPMKTSKMKLVDTRMAFVVLGVLMTAVAFRSALWTQYQNPSAHLGLLIPLGIAAFSGKLIGGFIADKLTWKSFIIITTLVATVCLVLGNNVFVLILVGVAFLQSTTPFVLMLMGRIFHKNIALAVGCILGLSIVLGGFIALIFTGANSWIIALTMFVILVLYILSLTLIKSRLSTLAKI